MFGRKSTALAAAKAWNPISQNQRRRQIELKAELSSCSGQVRRLGEKASALHAEAEQYVSSSLASGFSSTGIRQGIAREKLEEEAIVQRELDLYRETQAGIEAEIEELEEEISSQAAKRVEGQNRVATLAGTRLDKDTLIQSAIEGLRKLLNERAELTQNISAAAREIDLKVGHAGYDHLRSQALLDSLPTEWANASQQWVDWLLGKEQGDCTYVVRDEIVLLPETLTNHGVSLPGEQVRLSEAEARNVTEQMKQMRSADLPRLLHPFLTKVEEPNL